MSDTPMEDMDREQRVRERDAEDTLREDLDGQGDEDDEGEREDAPPE